MENIDTIKSFVEIINRHTPSPNPYGPSSHQWVDINLCDPLWLKPVQRNLVLEASVSNMPSETIAQFRGAQIGCRRKLKTAVAKRLKQHYRCNRPARGWGPNNCRWIKYVNETVKPSLKVIGWMHGGDHKSTRKDDSLDSQKSAGSKEHESVEHRKAVKQQVVTNKAPAGAHTNSKSSEINSLITTLVFWTEALYLAAFHVRGLQQALTSAAGAGILLSQLGFSPFTGILATRFMQMFGLAQGDMHHLGTGSWWAGNKLCGVDDRHTCPHMPSIVMLYELLRPMLEFLIIAHLNVSWTFVLGFQMFAGLLCEARKVDDRLFARREGDRNSMWRTLIIDTLAHDFGLDMSKAGRRTAGAVPHIDFPAWVNRSAAEWILDVFSAMLMRFSRDLRMTVRRVRPKAVTLYREAGFQRCRVNQWSWMCDLGTLCNWRVLSRNIYPEATRAQPNWARSVDASQYIQDWPVFLSNVALSVTIVASATLRNEVNYVGKDDLALQKLLPIVHKLSAYHYPYGRSINACRAEKISPLIRPSNWPGACNS